MVKFHLTPSGLSRSCSAQPGNCRYGENGIDPEHYSTKEEAQTAYENSMKENIFSIVKSKGNKQHYKSFGFENTLDFINSRSKLEQNIISPSFLTDEEKQVAEFYSTVGYRKINDYLYSDEEPVFISESKSSFFKNIFQKKEKTVQLAEDDFKNLPKVIKILDNAIGKSDKSSKHLFRGVMSFNPMFANKPVKNWINERKVGEVLDFKGYLSTSVAVDKAVNRDIGTASVVFEIKTCEGLDMINLSYHSREKEVLLPRDSEYEIVGIHKEVYLKEIDKTISVIQMIEKDLETRP